MLFEIVLKVCIHFFCREYQLNRLFLNYKEHIGVFSKFKLSRISTNWANLNNLIDSRVLHHRSVSSLIMFIQLPQPQETCNFLSQFLLNVFHVRLFHFYRPQRNWDKVMFLHVCVILFTWGRGSASVHAGIPFTPQEQAPPWDQAPPWTRHNPRPGTPRSRPPPGPDTPQTRHPPEQPPSGPGTPGTSRRYASYWNAILLCRKFIVHTVEVSSLYHTHWFA